MEFGEIKSILEELTGKERFSGRAMRERINPILISQEVTSKLISPIQKRLGNLNYEYMVTGLLRNVFLIELVNDDISTTKMEVRWVLKRPKGKKQEGFDQTDPRFCLFEDCVKILLKLLEELRTSVENEEIRNLLKLYQKYNLLPYEIPLDYISSPIIDKSLTHIHCLKNIKWVWDEKYQKTLKLREILLNPDKNDKHKLFSSILKDKIKVKTYLTDRVQTGKHKTDREKRWEVHPESVHFAFRRDCLEIENELITQLCHFEGFPPNLFELLKKERLIPDREKTRCPSTLNVFSFQELEKEILNPVHGKSSFQVGHLNPLKSGEPAAKHVATNTSWVSAEGNRIQGDLSLKEVRKLLGRILGNYRNAGIELE